MIATAKRQPDLTRQALLAAAFEEIHRSGFRAASLDAILAKTGVTKGALYHHFGSKTELGYAVVEEVIRPFIESHWRPVVEAPDPMAAALQQIRQVLATRSEMALTLGCPFNNLCQEMSSVDEGFRARLVAILDDWREAIARSMQDAQARGQVRKDADPQAVAAFIISSIEGCAGMAKTAQSREFLGSAMQGLADYLQHLRPAGAQATGALS